MVTSDRLLRDQFATAEQLASIITAHDQDRENPSEQRQEILADPEHPRHDAIMISDWWLRLVSLGARYSLGVPIEELRGDFARAVEHAPYQQWTRQQTVSRFVEFFWLASWARLLDDTASQQRLRRETAAIGHNDSLLDAVLSDDPPAALSTETRRSVAPEKKYAGLVEAAVLAQGGDGPGAAERFRRYVSAEWYRSFQSADWWGNHKRLNDLDTCSYKGYWAYEAAAVAHAFGIDDSALEGHKYYPWDLAHADNPTDTTFAQP